MTSAVVTKPVDLPCSLAYSNTDFKGFLSLSTEIEPLYVLWPVAKAVPPAAESVTFSLGSLGLVRLVPFKYLSKAVWSNSLVLGLSA